MKFLLYCFCGGLGVSSDYVIYYLLVSSGVWYQYGNFSGYLCGTLVSFFLNRIITFDKKDLLVRRLSIFVGVASVGFAISMLMLWIMVDYIYIDPKISKLLTLPVVVVIQFILNKKITFK